MKWFVLNGVTLLDLTLQVLFWAVPVVIVIVVAAVLLIRWDRKKWLPAERRSKSRSRGTLSCDPAAVGLPSHCFCRGGCSGAGLPQAAASIYQLAVQFADESGNQRVVGSAGDVAWKQSVLPRTALPGAGRRGGGNVGLLPAGRVALEESAALFFCSKRPFLWGGAFASIDMLSNLISEKKGRYT